MAELKPYMFVQIKPCKFVKSKSSASNFFILHAHPQYIYNIFAKCWKDPVTALRGVDFTKYALSAIIY